jgi:redox-sensitive bicupin YhaK (pirin superfamily)
MSQMTIHRARPMNLSSEFRAYSLRGDASGEPIDPFLGVDHAWISAPTFAPHPHAGFSALSYLFLDSETGIANFDSRGARNLIRPGGLHWTAAGRGILHEEFPAEAGKTVHMLQIFVNLARERQSAAPFTLSLAPEDVPTVQLPGVTIRVPLGRFADRRSPLTPPTEVTILDVLIDDRADLSVPVPAGQAAFVMPIFGTLSVNGQQVERDGFAVPTFAADTAEHVISLAALGGAAGAVVFAGAPLRQPVHWRGSLALASAEALASAAVAFQHGEFGTLASHAPASNRP